MPKYHFLTICERANGRSLVTLPGQTFGRNPVPEHVLVKDVKGSTVLTRTKRKGRTGEVFFTTSLTAKLGYCTAKDIHPLEGNDNVLYQDACDEYERLTKQK